MSARPRILLLRDPGTSDPYVAALEAAGFDAYCVPVLHFDFVDCEGLAETMERVADYGGLILTSPRAVAALENLDLTAWHAVPSFVVGPATAEAARTLGLRVEGEEAGEADVLASVVTARQFDAPLLFLCGDRRRDALPDRLRSAGVTFEARVVYRTRLDASALHEVASSPPDWVVFFSPSGVEAVRSNGSLPWSHVRKAAIGSTTAESLRDAGFSPSAVAAAPTPHALAAAVSLARYAPDA